MMNSTHFFKLKTAFACLCLLLLPQIIGAQMRDEQRGRLQVGNLTRTYLFYVPAIYRKTQSVPLVFVLHGGGGQGANMPRFSGMSALAERENFIVVYPDGINRQWNDGRENVPTNADDVAFFAALIERFAADYNIDRRRIHAVGISNGGFMAQRLACELADKFAATASIAATMSENLAAQCKPAREVSVLLMHGTEDPLVPYNGGYVRIGRSERGKILSAADAARFWATRNGCALAPVRETLPDADPNDGTRVRRDLYEKCKAGTSVAFYTIEGGGHTWAGSVQYLPVRFIGRTSRDINASEIVWQFFKQHPQR
jgi:polyhydroxybutyrate depolymerase